MATDGGVKPLQNAMKMAKVAIQLDGGSRHKEAYCEYLRTINFISHALLEEAGSQKDREMVSVEVERMLTLAEQCLERAKSFVEKTPDPADTFASCSTDQSQPRQTAELPVVAAATNTGSKPTSPVKSGHRRVMSDGGGDLAPFLPPEVFHKLQTVQSLDTNRKELTPIEQASRQNQKLKANYEARLARLTPGQAYQKTSLVRT